MEVKNAVMPNEDQIKEFSEQGEDKPIYMVNLLKFKEKANYPDKRETDLTGEEAYAISVSYTHLTLPTIYSV